MVLDEDVARIRFGGFELQPRERRLLARGQSMAVGPRAFDLLVALVERAGKLVRKDELLDLVWPKLIVEESNLHVQVSALRKILGPESIATIPGHGYRFALELERVPIALALPPDAPPHNLPEQVTSFIGRERELAEIGQLLESHRLLTLLGAGGIGKTRLSLQAAATTMSHFPGGAWFVELAPLADPRLVPQEVVSALGVKEAPGRPVIDALLDFVRDRRLLIILDNCEHLTHACAELVRLLLRSGAYVKILATSRDYLHVAGETTYPVSPLGIPDQHTIDIGAVLRCESGQLFADRAVASQSTFHVTAHNAPAIADICRHLDGIPLALELAAARVRALSPEKIAARLGDRFRLLTNGDQSSLPRQQTLRACIDWSYELLTERERALLRRQSVFAGGWTLEAAEAIGVGGDVEVSDVLDLLTRLVEKSLVAMDTDSERYRLLETVRQYAQERLVDSGEADDVRARHAAFFLALAEEARPELLGTDQRAWFARLDLERENFLAVHAWCERADVGDELGLRLAFAIRHYWIHRGGLELGYRLAVEALARAPVEARSLVRCRGLQAGAVLASLMGRYAEAQGYLEEDLSIAREIGDEENIENALRMLGEQLISQGKLPEARRHLEEAVSFARRLGREWTINSLAEVYRMEGDLQRAESLYREGLAIASERGEIRAVSVALMNLASVSIMGGSRTRPAELLLEALPYIEQSGSRPLGAHMLNFSAGLAAFCSEWACAARLLGAATTQFEQVGFRPEPADETYLAPMFAKAREAMGAAAFAKAEAAARALSYDDAIAEARGWLENCRQAERPQLRAVR